MDFVIENMENDFADVAARTYAERLKGHGRIDEITYHQIPIPHDLPGKELWKVLRTIGVAIRHSKSSCGETDGVRYYISSLKPSVKKFAQCVRGHWAIENMLHWCFDVTLREGENRVRNRNPANNLAWLKRFAVSLLKQVDGKESIGMKRRMAGWNIDYPRKVLRIPV